MDKEQNFARALKELRKSKDITLDEISNSSKIKKEYLEKIENGNFSFKSKIYINLFLREYVSYIDKEKVDSIIQEFKNNFIQKDLIVDSDLKVTPISDSDTKTDQIDFQPNNYNPKKIASIIATIIVIILLYQSIANYFLS